MRYLSAKKSDKNQSGFAIALILLAVVLIAAIVAAIAASTNDANNDTDREEGQIYASTIVQQSSSIRTAIMRFYKLGYSDLNTIGDLYNHGFLSPSMQPPPGAFDGTPTQWEFGTVLFQEGSDVIVPSMLIRNVKPDVATALNTMLADTPGVQYLEYTGSYEVSWDMDESQNFAASQTPWLDSTVATIDYVMGEIFIGTAQAAPIDDCILSSDQYLTACNSYPGWCPNVLCTVSGGTYDCRNTRDLRTDLFCSCGLGSPVDPPTCNGSGGSGDDNVTLRINGARTSWFLQEGGGMGFVVEHDGTDDPGLAGQKVGFVAFPL